MSTECLLCGHDGAVLLLVVRSPLRPDEDTKLVRCSACGLGYLHPPPTAYELHAYMDAMATYGRAATADEAVHVRGDVFEAAASRLAGLCPNGGRVLDVGCGHGHLLYALRERGWEAWGVELSRAACQYARGELGLRHIQQGWIEEVPLPAGFFDAVVLLDVLYYCPDPRTTMQRLASLLTQSGAVLARVCSRIGLLDCYSRWHWLVHGQAPRIEGDRVWATTGDAVVYFSPATIRTLFEQCGLEVCRIEPSAANRVAPGARLASRGRHAALLCLNALDGIARFPGRRDPVLAPSITVEARAPAASRDRVYRGECAVLSEASPACVAARSARRVAAILTGGRQS